MYFAPASNMKLAVPPHVMPVQSGGLVFDHADTRQRLQVLNKLDELGLRRYLGDPVPGREDVFALSSEAFDALAGDSDTMCLRRALGLDTVDSMADLEREIVLAMLAAPRP